MSKIKNIAICLLLVLVIAVGLSAAVCASMNSGYVQCQDAYGRFVSDRIPYVEVYACYIGVNIDEYFQAVVYLNYNNTTEHLGLGNVVKSSNGTSTAYVKHIPAYGTETFTWTHYCALGNDTIEDYVELSN